MATQDLSLVRRLTQLARNSPWLVIAVGLHVIVGAALSVLYLQQEPRSSSPTATEIRVATHQVETAVLPPPPEFVRNKIPENVEVELVDFERQMTYVPIEQDTPRDLFEEVGEPDSDGGGESGSSSIGVGKGGFIGTGVSPFVRKRPGAGRGNGPQGVSADRPLAGTEKAVLEGLRWLARHQNDDGSWGADTLTLHCNPKSPCLPPEAERDPAYNVGMTSLALLAFLGQGFSVQSKALITDTALGERHSAGQIVKKGVKWLMERQRTDGSFSDSLPFEFPENETLATMVLCEAHALSHVSALRRPAQRALDFLVAAQKQDENGAPWGFGLGSRTDLEQRHARGELDDEAFAEARASVDLSITCWVVMALKSAKSCGFAVPEEALRGALDYCIAATGEGDPARPAEAAASPEKPDKKDGFLTHVGRVPALGMLIRSFVAQDINDPYLERAAQVIATDLPKVEKDGRSVDFYYWYFATLALNQFDGPDSPRKGGGQYWSAWEKGLADALLPLQDRDAARGACSRGGWLQEARGNQKGRALYNTAMNVLTLEVYYRFENVFGSAAREARPGRR